MKVTVSKRMLPVKMHYFFFFGGVAPVLPFLSIYARQLGISATGMGAVYMTLPVMAALLRPAVGALADLSGRHKAVFITTLLVTLAGYAALALIPPLAPANHTAAAAEPNSHSMVVPVTRVCRAINNNGSSGDNGTILPYPLQLPAPLVRYCCRRCSATRVHNYLSARAASATAGCRVECGNNANTATISTNTSTSASDNTTANTSATATATATPATVTATPATVTSRLNMSWHRLLSNSHCVEWSVTVAAAGSVGEGEEQAAAAERCTPTVQCLLSCDDGNEQLLQLMQAVPRQQEQQQQQQQHTVTAAYRSPLHFWLFAVLMIPAWVGTSITVPLADAIAFKLLDDPSRYGYERCWGSVGWGFFSLLSGFLIDKWSLGMQLKNFTPAFILLATLMVIDLVVCRHLRLERLFEAPPHFRSNVTSLLRRPGIVLFLLTCVVVGILTGVLWTYSFLYIDDLSSVWSCDSYQWVSFISGLTLFVQCLFGELPFFFLSGWIIGKLGPVYTQCLVLLSFGVRFLLYSTVTNPWHLLPVELFNGLTFGLFYANMVVYAGTSAPPGMVATLQGVAGALFECVGVAIGSGVGGVVYSQLGGAVMYQLFGGVSLITGALYCIWHWLQCLTSTRATGNSLPGDPQPGNTLPDNTQSGELKLKVVLQGDSLTGTGAL